MKIPCESCRGGGVGNLGGRWCESTRLHSLRKFSLCLGQPQARYVQVAVNRKQGINLRLASHRTNENGWH